MGRNLSGHDESRGAGYVRGIADRIAHDWGYRLFKMDGHWTGSATKQVYVNNGYVEDGIGDATFHNPDKTNIEALRDGTKLGRIVRVNQAATDFGVRSYTIDSTASGARVTLDAK